MDAETKFKVGQEVYKITDNRPQKYIVVSTKVVIETTEYKAEKREEYTIRVADGTRCAITIVDPSVLFATIEEMIDRYFKYL